MPQRVLREKQRGRGGKTSCSTSHFGRKQPPPVTGASFNSTNTGHLRRNHVPCPQLLTSRGGLCCTFP